MMSVSFRRLPQPTFDDVHNHHEHDVKRQNHRQKRSRVVREDHLAHDTRARVAARRTRVVHVSDADGGEHDAVRDGERGGDDDAAPDARQNGFVTERVADHGVAVE